MCVFIACVGKTFTHLWLNYKETAKEQYDHFCLESKLQSYLQLENWIKGQAQVKGRRTRALLVKTNCVSQCHNSLKRESSAVIRGLCACLSAQNLSAPLAALTKPMTTAIQWTQHQPYSSNLLNEKQCTTQNVTLDGWLDIHCQKL